MDLEEFTNATELLRGGIYVLVYRGEVMFVGAARGPMLAKIATARSTDRPKWMPKIPFDQILIKYIHPDRINFARAELIATYQPKFNHDAVIATIACVPIERRI